MLEINKEFIQKLEDLTRQYNAPVHKFYEESVDHAAAMGVHLTGDSAKKLLDVKRPNEDEEAKKYRIDAYKPKTKASASKAISVINRIYNERLFSIQFQESGIELIDEDYSLSQYLTEDYPYYTNFINYMRGVFTKMHLKDPNGCLAVLPKDWEIEDEEIFEPIPYFFDSKSLVDFEDEKYYIIMQRTDDYGPIKTTVFDDVAIYVFYKKKPGDPFELKFEYQHDFGVPPVFRVGGIVTNSEQPILYESFISGVLPHWDDATAMFSDLQAAVVNHLYPDKWEFTTDCNNEQCIGGQVRVFEDDHERFETCPDCQGTGKVTTKGPFNVYQVKREAINPDLPLQIPPFGYGEKELGSTELLEQLAEKEIRKGFEAINMDILNDVGENQSGVAKTIDRQDLDSFLNTYSNHVFNYIVPNILYLTIRWRYSALLGENIDEKIDEFFPIVKAPTTFDVFSIQMLTKELGELKQTGVNSKFLAAIEDEIIEKRFTNEHTKAFYKTLNNIDPLALLSDDQITTMSRVIDRVDLYIHAYSKDLVEKAIADDSDFLRKPLTEQKEKIRQLAQAAQTAVIVDEENPLNE